MERERTTTAEQASALAGTSSVRDVVNTFAPAVELVKRRPQEWSGPCPRCGGVDRFYITAGNRAACRQCHPARMDAVGVAAWILEVPMHQAVERMATVVPAAPGRRAASPPASRTAEDRTPSASWSWDAAVRVETAMERLHTDPRAEVQRDYLTRRGLTPATWATWRLGAATVQVPGTSRRAPAVCWPITHHADGQVIAVKFRLVDTVKVEDVRYTMLAGSAAAGHAFGTFNVWPSRRRSALVIVEGELNACSIGQAMAGSVDVVSIGSESSAVRLPDWLVEAGMSYNSVVVWLDRADMASAASARFVHALPLHSLREDHNVKGDANELLQRGQLEAVMAVALERGTF